MLLPDIDFAEIRLHRGTQADAFEELCCQIAGDEDLPTRVRFDRKGRGGDGGVECFATLADGSEVGWQVKYYSKMTSALASLDGSLTKALDKHPQMVRFIACLPFDLADSRKDDVKTALALWDAWRDKRTTDALAAGRTISIERWDAYEIKKRLTASNPASPGRLKFWFDGLLFTQDWFRSAFERTRASLGRRYSPESHIDLPIRRVIQATTLDQRLFDELRVFAEEVSEKLKSIGRSDTHITGPCETASNLFSDASQDDAASISIEALRLAVDNARSAVLPWYRALRDSNPPDQPQDSVTTAASNLLSVLNNVARALAAEHWNYLKTKSLLVVGAAGSGKSHLLADVCDRAIDSGHPAIMVLGGKLPDGEPWSEVLKDLGLADLPAETFLGMLNAAGQAAGVRTLLMIDALNEKNGQAIWPERLTGLVHDTAQFEWISLILSCRSTYEELVIPDALNSTVLPRVVHSGFSIGAARRYLSKRGISLTEEPNSIAEFQYPLFLRICCDALLSMGGAVLTPSLGGVTAVFKLYSDAVVKSVNTRIGTPPARKLVERAIDTIAQEMADTGKEEICLSRAYDLLQSLIPAVASTDQDVLFQLQNEGLLSVQPGYELDDEEELRFTFQRMGDHALANSLIIRSVNAGNVLGAMTSGTPLSRALNDEASLVWPGLLEALAVQLPEKYNVEVSDIFEPKVSWQAAEAFKESLMTRRNDAYTDHTWELIDRFGGPPLRYETLIAHSTDPGNLHNADFLDQELRALSMPQRDATWSAHVSRGSDQASHLIEWVRQAHQSSILDERARLTGILLCWFLTASSRLIRDTATKSLTALLADHAGLAADLWLKFQDIDDAYVSERLLAAIYGAALQGRWTAAELLNVVEKIHEMLFARADFPPNILSRDHGRNLVRFAKARGALPEDFTFHLAAPPYGGDWPIEYVTDAAIESYKRSYRGTEQYRDEITSSSVSDGDFARYQIDYAIGNWSATQKWSGTLLTSEDLATRWFQSFEASATPAMLSAYNALMVALAAAAELDLSRRRNAEKSATEDFKQVVGEDIFASWRAEVQPWQRQGMFQNTKIGNTGPAQFNLSWARRWVCKRAHDLGWSEQLHGQFDSEVKSDRHSHQCERIGKKYQWLALYELCARMADNLEPLPNHDDDPVDIARLRNIDASLLVSKTADDGWSRFENPYFWVPPSPNLDKMPVEGALDWLHSEQDIFDTGSNLEVTNPEDQTRWLVLRGFETWRSPKEDVERETWRRISCIVVRQQDVSNTLALMKGLHFQADHDLPTARGSSFKSYLGEHPWLWRSDDEEDDQELDDEWLEQWRPRAANSKLQAVSIRPTTTDYLAEASGYDASINQNINLILPAAWLMDGLGLRLTDGATIRYVDDGGVVRFMDPSVALNGRSAALIEREALMTYLDQNGFAAVWALSGEKNVYGGDHTRGFGGRWTFTRLFYSENGVIIPLDRFQTFEAPSSDQLKALRGEIADADDEDDTSDHSLDDSDDDVDSESFDVLE